MLQHLCCFIFSRSQAAEEDSVPRSTCVPMWKLYASQIHVCQSLSAFWRVFIHTVSTWWRVLRVNSWPEMDDLSLFKGKIISRHLFWMETRVFPLAIISLWDMLYNFPQLANRGFRNFICRSVVWNAQGIFHRNNIINGGSGPWLLPPPPPQILLNTCLSWHTAVENVENKSHQYSLL